MSLHKRHAKVLRHRDAMVQIISRINWNEGMTRQKLDKAITKELISIWRSTWTEEEFQLKAKIERGEHAYLPHEVFLKLDKIILRQAETLGWRLLVCTRVLHRISMWEAERNGPELFERLGKALAKSIRIVQRKELPPIDDPNLVSTHDQSIRELQTVLREMRRKFSAMRSNIEDREILDFFSNFILDSGKRFPLLKANLLRWMCFLEETPSYLKSQISDKRISPAALFLSWLSWCKGQDPETIRKKISALRRP